MRDEFANLQQTKKAKVDTIKTEPIIGRKIREAFPKNSLRKEDFHQNFFESTAYPIKKFRLKKY